MRRGWPVASRELEKWSKVWAHTHTETKRLVWHPRGEFTHTLLLLCLIWMDFSESRMAAWENVCKCSKIPMRRRRREKSREGSGTHWGQGGGYHGHVGVVPWHKHASQTVTMPVASPNYSTMVLISNSCISKAHEMLKHLRGWRCCKWGNG